MSLFDTRSRQTDLSQELERALAFLKRVRHFGWVIAAFVLAGALASAAFLLLRSPKYLSETVILYNEGIRATDNARDAAPQARSATVRLKEVLLARPLLGKLIDEYRLYPELVKKHGYVDAVDEFRKDVEFRAPGSDTFTIAFRTDSAEKAQRVTARLAETLISQDSKIRNQQAKVTRDFLASERQRTEKELKDAELALAKFMADNPGFALDSMLFLPGASATGAAIRASANARSAEARAAPRPSPGTWRTTPGSGVATPSAVPGSVEAPASAPVVQDPAEKARAEAALAAAQTNLADKLTRFTEAHPDAKSAQAAVLRAEQRLQGFAAPAPAPAPPAAAPTQALPAAPGAEPRRVFVAAHAAASTPAQSKGRTADDLVELETQWAKLTRDVTEARERHDQLEASFFKADIAASSESGGQAVQIEIIDPAYLPLKPLPPGRLTLVAIFLALSSVLGLLAAIGCAAFDDRIYDARDAAALSPILTEVPSAPRTRRAHANA